MYEDIEVIDNEEIYHVILDRIHEIFNTVEENTPEGKELDRLVSLVEDYENRCYSIDFE